MPGDVAFRGSWTTLDNKGIIVDRRAGLIRKSTKELSSSVCGLKIDDVSLYVGSGTEHRLALFIRGSGLGDFLSGRDPGVNFLTDKKTRYPEVLKKNDKKCLHLFEQEARKILAIHPVSLDRKSKRLLPANSILTREPGQVYAFPKLKRPSS